MSRQMECGSVQPLSLLPSPLSNLHLQNRDRENPLFLFFSLHGK